MAEIYTKKDVAPTPSISINQITKFIKSTESGKLRIVKNQKYPPKIPTAYYSSATAAMRRYIKAGFDSQIIMDVIEQLQSKVVDPNNKNAVAKKANLISALRKFLEITFPDVFKSIKFSFSTSKFRRCRIGDVDVIISPDVIIRRVVDGINYIGAIKFDVHKDSLDYPDGRQRAALLYYFLESVRDENEVVDRNYCLCVDVMHGNIYRPISDITDDISVIGEACGEVYKLWKIA